MRPASSAVFPHASDSKDACGCLEKRMRPNPKTYAYNAPERCHSLLRLEFILRENALFHTQHRQKRKPQFREVRSTLLASFVPKKIDIQTSSRKMSIATKNSMYSRR
ncbi:hypothetical protein L596_016290 [Steinernema carpocapsae]|uniref:Uncharacterized protein n=1 Tax=Steinernema carpocapsae TaxID=34508 RepID=A0A4U5NIM5_STECR|nr:hypothetical protein L596_016290 [Steinernema carpocapsae]